MLKTIGRNQFLKFFCNQYYFSSKPQTIGGGEDNKVNRKKSVGDILVTLISNDKDVTVVRLTEAQKLSKRNDLKLVKILDIDAKTQRPVYKLMSGAEYYIEDLKKRVEKKEAKNNETSIKGEKLLPISCKIGQNDLQTRVKNIDKWLAKRYEIKVVISGSEDDIPKMEDLCTKITKHVGESGKILQKQLKGSEMKFRIYPVFHKQETSAATLLNEPQKRQMHSQSGPKEL